MGAPKANRPLGTWLAQLTWSFLKQLIGVLSEAN